MAKAFEQGALDSLWEAKRAIERSIRAILAYEECRNTTKHLTVDEGPLFAMWDIAMWDNVLTAQDECVCAFKIAMTGMK